MHQLLYISNAVELMSEQQLESLLHQAQANNKSLDITGMLVYHDGSFIQILEGEEETIKALFEKVKNDPRHDNIILIEDAPVESRAFGSWDMAFHQLTVTELKQYPAIHQVLNSYSQPDSDVLPAIVDIFLHLAVS